MLKNILLQKIVPAISEGLKNNPNDLFHDILIFQHAKDLVKDLVTEINTYYPDPRFVAIPIFSNIPQIVSDLIEDKVTFLKKINCPRSQVLDFIFGKKTDKIKTDYRYLIIVGTPIIEESITVRHLRYVIDSGLEQKVLQIYQTKQIYVSFINRNSQIQRQGRICRIPGIPGDYYSLFSPEQIVDAENPGLLNFDPLPILLQIASLVKSYPSNFMQIFGEKYESLFFSPHAFVCENLISRLQFFSANQIVQNYIFPFDDIDKEYLVRRPLEQILRIFVQRQTPYFEQIINQVQPYFFIDQNTLLKKQYKEATKKRQINKILIYMSYFILQQDFPPNFEENSQKENAKKPKNFLGRSIV
jgi:hypothetical protein